MGPIKIVLDEYPGVCYPGQTIAGRIECNFEEETNFRAVRIKFKGRAKTRWTVRKKSGKTTRTVTYSAEEKYFEAEYNLVEGGDDRQLSAGHHSYGFAYILPPGLPSSFEGQYGNVRYYIKVTVDRPWKLDYDDLFGLNVFSSLDLNYLSGLREPVAISDDKTMCSCWCNDSGALTFNMSLPVTGFVPGQAINIPSSVVNMTNVTAENVRYKITAELEFIARDPSTRRKYDSYRVAEQIDGGIGAHGEKSWSSVLNIPAHTPVPNLTLCNIINVKYILKGEVVVPCPHTNLDLETPVMIGHVPLTGVESTFYAGGPPTMSLPVEGTPLLPLGVVGGVSYPSVAEGSSSAPPVGFSGPINPSAPYPSAGPSQLQGAKDSDKDFGLPSYDDAKEMNQKN